ncbi:MAG: hypothetical protein AABY27_04170 [Pseudomonadota bacterium]
MFNLFKFPKKIYPSLEDMRSIAEDIICKYNTRQMNQLNVNPSSTHLDVKFYDQMKLNEQKRLEIIKNPNLTLGEIKKAYDDITKLDNSVFNNPIKYETINETGGILGVINRFTSKISWKVHERVDSTFSQGVIEDLLDNDDVVDINLNQNQVHNVSPNILNAIGDNELLNNQNIVFNEEFYQTQQLTNDNSNSSIKILPAPFNLYLNDH